MIIFDFLVLKQILPPKIRPPPKLLAHCSRQFALRKCTQIPHTAGDRWTKFPFPKMSPIFRAKFKIMPKIQNYFYFEFALMRSIPAHRVVVFGERSAEKWDQSSQNNFVRLQSLAIMALNLARYDKSNDGFEISACENPKSWNQKNIALKIIL